MTAVDRKSLAVLLRRAGLPVTAKRLNELAGPARYIAEAGRRLAISETAKLSPVGALWKRDHD